MHDKFMFSDAQALSTLDGTGVKSTDIYDMEYDAEGNLITTDGYVHCWLNVILTSIASTAADEGMYIKLVESAAVALTSPRYLGVIQLLETEMVTGNMYSIGVCKQLTLRYVGVWYMAHTTPLDGANAVEAWISEGPLTSPTYRCQKRPT